MNEKAPVKAGDRFVSTQTGKEAVVERTAHYGTALGWAACVRIEGALTWLTCSKDGIKGYRRKA